MEPLLPTNFLFQLQFVEFSCPSPISNVKDALISGTLERAGQVFLGNPKFTIDKYINVCQNWRHQLVLQNVLEQKTAPEPNVLLWKSLLHFAAQFNHRFSVADVERFAAK